MKTTLLVACAAVALCAASVDSAATAATQHVKIHVRGHARRHGRDTVRVSPITHGKFTVLDIGRQCAHDPKNDPSLYPCRDGGVCIRTAPDFGKCFSKEEAARYYAANATQSDSGSDSDSGSGSGSSSRAGVNVGDDDRDDDASDSDSDSAASESQEQDDDSEDADEDGDGDGDDDDSVDVPTKPPQVKA